MHDGEHWAVQSRSQDACRCLVACFWQSLAMLCVLAPFPRFKLAAPSLLFLAAAPVLSVWPPFAGFGACSCLVARYQPITCWTCGWALFAVSYF